MKNPRQSPPNISPTSLTPNARAPAAASFRVVCLGGSAGALTAYTGILRILPADTGMAFVVATHRGFEHAHLLPHILAGSTSMSVVEVEQGMLLEPNRVFVMPPGKDMTVSGDVFGLRTTVKPRGWPITINLFLLSLAEAAAIEQSSRGDHSLRHGP
jgi:two-component system CheB/CheR fusion protein